MPTEQVEFRLSRVLSAGAMAFAVGTTDATDAELLDELFSDLPDADPAANCQVYTFQRARDGEVTQWTISGPRAQASKLTDLSGALSYLIGAVNLAALDSQPDLLHLHAAAASRPGGGAVVIAADRNTGKTTTVAHLLERGWQYLTDETVAVHRGSSTIVGFAKPLSIKPGGLMHLPHLVHAAVPLAGDDAMEYRFVTVGRTGAPIVRTARPELVVLLVRPDGHTRPEASARPLAPGDAAVMLMQQTLDADRFGPESVEVLLNLVAQVRCYEVSVGTPESTAQLLNDLASESPAPPVQVRRHDASEHLEDEVDSFRVGDSAVIYQRATGEILALNEAATLIWEHLAGWGIRPDLDVASPAIRGFVDQLRALRLVRSPHG